MNVSKLLCSLALLLYIPVFVEAQNDLTKVKLYPADKQQRSEIFGLLGIDHFMPATDGGIEAEISQADLQRLKRSNYKYTVLIPNVSRWLDSANQVYFKAQRNPAQRVAFEQSGNTINTIIPKPTDFVVKATSAGYYRFAEMEAAIDTLIAKYPGIARKDSIGRTYNNRALWVVKISDNVNVDEAEPEAFFMGLQHAREAITGASMIFFMQYLCEQYSRDSKVKDLVDSREIFIMPCFNPDGYEYNFATNPNGGGSWRKNRSPTSGGNFGVDLNRNWGKDWGTCDSATILGDPASCGSTSTLQETYIGPYRFSELETDALRAFTQTRHFSTAFDQHAYGPYYSLPFGRKSLHNTAATDMSTKDSNFYKVIPALMGKYNGMRAADSYDALGYEVAGGFKDWMLMGDVGVGTKDSVWGLTGEGAAGGGNSAFGGMSNFWAPASQIVNLSKGMCFQNLQLAYAAGTYVDVQDASDITLTAKSGSLSCNLRRIGLGNNPVTVSLIPIENIQATSAPVTIAGMSYYQLATATITYTLPTAITNGQRVKFAWKVEADGITYYDTVTKFLNPTQLFYDDMEGSFAANWSNTAGRNVSSGFGYNYSKGTWLFTTSGGYNASKALSESAAGTNYSSSTLSIAECNTVFNLTGATAAYLSFWTRHRAENFRDKVQVQVSTDGSTWTPIKGSTTIQEPGTLDGATLNGEPSLTGVQDDWTQELFNLDAYRGNTTVTFRFVFTSDNDPSSFKFEVDDGFYIDNVKVIKSTTALVTLPVTFTSFTGKLLTDKTVQLKWEAITDNEHDYFEVERSADAINFSTIGTVRQTKTELVDQHPNSGANYYRIRQVDKNGGTSYSTIILINIDVDYKVKVFPNPALEAFQVSVFAQKPADLSLVIKDVLGRTVVAGQKRVYPGTNKFEIDCKAWQPQIYFLQLVDKAGSIIYSQRISKH